MNEINIQTSNGFYLDGHLLFGLTNILGMDTSGGDEQIFFFSSQYLSIPTIFDQPHNIWPSPQYLTIPTIFDHPHNIWPSPRYLFIPTSRIICGGRKSHLNLFCRHQDLTNWLTSCIYSQNQNYEWFTGATLNLFQSNLNSCKNLVGELVRFVHYSLCIPPKDQAAGGRRMPSI